MRIFNADGSEAEMCGDGIHAWLAFWPTAMVTLWTLLGD